MSDKQVIRHVGDYEALRRQSYPPIEDFIDAYYWSQRGNPALMTEYLAKVDQVKAKVPKIGKEKV